MATAEFTGKSAMTTGKSIRSKTDADSRQDYDGDDDN